MLTRDEVRAVLEQLLGAPRLMGLLLSGAGPRLLEQQLDLERGAGQTVPWEELRARLYRR